MCPRLDACIKSYQLHLPGRNPKMPSRPDLPRPLRPTCSSMLDAGCPIPGWVVKYRQKSERKYDKNNGCQDEPWAMVASLCPSPFFSFLSLCLALWVSLVVYCVDSLGSLFLPPDFSLICKMHHLVSTASALGPRFFESPGLVLFQQELQLAPGSTQRHTGGITRFRRREARLENRRRRRHPTGQRRISVR